MSIQRIPIHAGEDLIFTPESLKDQTDVPSFTLKTVTRLGREEMEFELLGAGLVRHTTEDIRAVYVAELCRLWGCEEDHADIQQVKDYWQASDDHAEEYAANNDERLRAIETGEEPPAELGPFSHPEEKKFSDLFRRAQESSGRIRRILVDNSKWSRNFPRIALQYCLKSWTGIETPFNCWDQRPLVETIVELEAELARRWDIQGQAAFAELTIAAIQRYYLDQSAEKNSKSPAPSQPTPEATKEAGSAKKRGRSPASASSEATPES